MKPMKKKALIIFGLIILAIILERVIAATSIFKQLELISYDLRAKIATDYGPFNKRFKHTDKDIVIIAIDDYSRREISDNPQLDIGSWPWRRDVWSGLTKFIEKGEPKAILFDLIFNDLNENPWNDRRFAQTLRRYDNVVLATSLNDPKYLVDKNKNQTKIVNAQYLPTSKPLNVEIKDKKLDNAITYYSHAPIHDMYTEYNTMGVVNKVVDADSVIRRSQPIFKLVKDGETYYMPSLAFAGFLKYMGEGGDIVVNNGKIFYKGREIPINKKGEVNISWHGYGKNYTYIPISKILLSEDNEEYVKSDFFKNKIVIIGRTEAGTDIHQSAVSPSFTGPESNAVALDNLINDTDINANPRKFVTEMPAFNEFVMIVLSCVILGFIGVYSKNAFLGFANSALFFLIYILMCVLAFTSPHIRIWIPTAVPLYYMFFTTAAIYTYRLHKESSKKMEIMNVFGKFVSPSVLENLLKNADNLVLKNTRKPITIMFCDIKDFTSLSERCNPEDLMDNVNELFNEIVNIIFENNGTVDKFIGDAIMAYWGDPIASDDDAFYAVKAALEIRKKVNEMKVANAKDNKIIFDVKIGINTGTALLGLAGSEKLMSYTAMGDAVNTAARLESVCSKHKRDILISKSTYRAVKSKIVALEAGKVELKGKMEEIEVFEPIGLKEDEIKIENE